MPSLDDKVKEFGIRWKDLTSLGLPSSGLGEQFLSNEQLYEMDPDRLNFYLQFLSAITGSNPDVVKKVLAKENLTRHQREQMNDSMRKVYKYFHKQKADHNKLMQTTTNTITDRTTGISRLELKDIYTSENYPTITDVDQALKVEDINALNKNPKITALKEQLPFLQSLDLEDSDSLETLKDALKTFKQEKQGLMAYRDEMDRINEGLKSNILTANSTIQPAVPMEKLREVQGGGEPMEGGATYKDFRKLYDAEQIPDLKIKDGYDENTDKFDKDPKKTDFKVVNEVTGRKALPTEKVTKPVVDAYMSSASFSPEVEKVTMGDRVIFLLATYILRGMALFLLEWGVYTNFIDSFNKAFAFYFGIYACIFLLLYILVNARQDDYVFRMLFFYINTQSENNKGVLRIIVHLLSILMLFPIPFIVKEFRDFKKEGVLTFSEKRTIVNAVGRFTLFIWIFTSIIALRF